MMRLAAIFSLLLLACPRAPNTSSSVSPSRRASPRCPVQTIGDLRGRAIGVGAMTWGTLPQTRSLLRNSGLHPGSDVDIVAVGILGAGFNGTWNDMLEAQGTRLRRLPFPPACRRMISNSFVAHQDTLRDHPGLLARFGRVVTESIFICNANPRFCVDAFWRAHPESKPKEGDPAQVLADAVATVTKSTAKSLDDDTGHERNFGQFDLGIIRDYVEAIQQSGEFTSSDIPIERLFSNALVPDFKQFDRAALIECAHAAH